MKCLFYMVIGLLCAPTLGEATTVKTFAFGGLCETAKTIVHVKCLEKKSILEPGVTEMSRKGIYTQYRFSVHEVVKGQAQNELVLVLPGGQYDGQRTEVAGMPEFELGQETVLFLSEPDAYGSPWPVGLGQGCYGVAVGDDGTRHVAFEHHHPVDPALRTKPSVQKTVSLQAFVGAIRGALQVDESSERDSKQ